AMALWDSPRQREAHDWFSVELANLRAAFRWAAGHNDLGTAATIAVYAVIAGVSTVQYEPISWAEELIDAAKAENHRRLVQLYATAAQCYVIGRVDDAVGYIEAARAATQRGGFDEVPYDFEGSIYSAYTMQGQPAKCAALIREMIGRNPGTHLLARACLVLALAVAGADVDALAAAEGLLADAEVAANPTAKALAMYAYAWVYSDHWSASVYDLNLQALTVVRECGNRYIESVIVLSQSRLAMLNGDLVDAFDHLLVVLRRYRDSG